MDLNKVMLIGNLTRDPELRYTPAGQAVTSFGLATNRRWTNSQTGEQQEQVEFHNIVAWGKLAETCNQILAKGRKTYIEGRLQTRSWEGQDGVKKYRTEVVSDNVIVLDRKPSDSEETSPKDVETSQEPSPDTPAEEEKGKIKKEKESKKEEKKDAEEIDVDDIPF